MSFIVNCIFTLSHEQASVERGFSQNNTAISNNIENDTKIARRLVKDHMIANHLKSYDIKITNSMLVSTTLVCNLFETHQAET